MCCGIRAANEVLVARTRVLPRYVNQGSQMPGERHVAIELHNPTIAAGHPEFSEAGWPTRRADRHEPT